MKPIPIFDTNVFSAAERGKIPDSQWRALRRHRRGWSLSSVTALELLAGMERVPFESTRRMLNLAWNLSNGRVLEDPRPMICTKILHVPLHADFVPFAATISRYIDVARRAASVDELITAKVPYKRGQSRLRSKGGD